MNAKNKTETKPKPTKQANAVHVATVHYWTPWLDEMKLSAFLPNRIAPCRGATEADVGKSILVVEWDDGSVEVLSTHEVVKMINKRAKR